MAMFFSLIPTREIGRVYSGVDASHSSSLSIISSESVDFTGETYSRREAFQKLVETLR
jgi:hypothetical protein